MIVRLKVKNFLESKTLTSCLFVLAYLSSGAWPPPANKVLHREPTSSFLDGEGWSLYQPRAPNWPGACYQSLLPVEMKYIAS